MTIGSISRADYVGNGTLDEYEFGFKIFNKEHLRLVVRNTADAEAEDIELVLDTDFEVPSSSVNNPDGGLITLLDAGQDWIDGSGFLDTDWSLAIIREVPLAQTTDVKNQGSYYPKIHEDAFDYLMMALLQQQANLDRQFRLPDSLDPDDYDLFWPSNMIDNPGSLLLVNPTGTGFILGPDAGDINDAQANSAAAAASAAAALVSQSAAAASAAAALASQTAAAASAAAAASLISDTAYDRTTWDGVTTISASKNAIRDAIQQLYADTLGVWRNVLVVAGSHIAGRVAGTYLFAHESPLVLASGGSLYPLATIALASADLANIAGLSARLRVKGELFVNDVAPTGDYTLGLYPITRPATSGGAGLNIYTPGTVISGSTCLWSAPAADSSTIVESTTFIFPGQAVYALGLVTTATVAVSSHIHINAQLQLKWS